MVATQNGKYVGVTILGSVRWILYSDICEIVQGSGTGSAVWLRGTSYGTYISVLETQTSIIAAQLAASHA